MVEGDLCVGAIKRRLVHGTSIRQEQQWLTEGSWKTENTSDCVFVCVCVRACVRACVRVCMRAGVCVHACMCACVCMCACICE